MAILNFNTGNETFRQLFGNGLQYEVPRFQRDYSWTEEQWEELWEDITVALSASGDSHAGSHYMGYLVLQSSDHRRHSVIDGQQRLTTLTLLVLAIIKKIDALAESGVDADANARRSAQLRNAYVGYVDPVTLLARPKLSLNQTNDAFFKDYIVPLLPAPRRAVRASNQLMRKAFEFFVSKLGERFDAQRDGAAYAKFLDDLADRLVFTVIRVADELNAFKVFETLNARGVRLSPTDLLKNYLFSVVHREKPTSEEVDALERRWDSLVGEVNDENFPDFLRVHWNSRHAFVREANLFKTVRETIGDKGAAFALLRRLDQDVEIFRSLSNPDGDFWTREERRFVDELRLFNIRQPWPLLIAARRVFDPSGFEAILRACSVISFRYNVIGGRSTAEQERTYSRISRDIADGKLTSAFDVIRRMQPIYPSDEAFRADFVVKQFKTTSQRNKSVASHILFRLERQLTGAMLDRGDANYTLEHVLPEKPAELWPGFSEESADWSVYRLGNLTPLEKKLNRDIGNAGFEVKRTAYEQSAFAITRAIAERNAEWTPQRIEARQEFLAGLATAVWRIAQLSE